MVSCASTYSFVTSDVPPPPPLDVDGNLKFGTAYGVPVHCTFPVPTIYTVPFASRTTSPAPAGISITLSAPAVIFGLVLTYIDPEPRFFTAAFCPPRSSTLTSEPTMSTVLIIKMPPYLSINSQIFNLLLEVASHSEYALLEMLGFVVSSLYLSCNEHIELKSIYPISVYPSLSSDFSPIA